MISTELRLALAPAATYRRLLESDRSVRGWRVLERPLLVLLVIATVVPIMALQRVTLSLVATAALSWSVVVAIQLTAAMLLIVSARGRRVTLTQAIDLWFAGHLPYSLWLLVAAVLAASSIPVSLAVVLASAILPLSWTLVVGNAFCRVVLGTSAVGARWRLIGQQCIVWIFALMYVAWAIAARERLQL